jgi:hypothetical protein
LEKKIEEEEGNAITFLMCIPRTTLRGLFGILTTPWMFFFSTLEGLLRPEVLASIGLNHTPAAIAPTTGNGFVPKWFDVEGMQFSTFPAQLGHAVFQCQPVMP